jgi:hypothetical protein
VRNARRVWFRDPISAARARVLRPAPDEACLGVDGALLMTVREYEAIGRRPAEGADGTVCIHFGRLSEALQPSARLVSTLSRAVGLDPVWLPWLGLDSTAVEPFRRALPELSVPHEPVAYEALVSTLLGARLVVSDTYHLCVIAWRLGIPAVCVGVGAQRAVRPISDKKKEIFFLSQGIASLYLFHEDVADATNHVGMVGEVKELAFDERYVTAVAASLEVQSAAAADDLRGAIAACLR